MITLSSSEYPSMSFNKAIAKVNMAYETHYNQPVDKLSLVKAMDYRNLNGTSHTTITSLKKYGLLEEVDKDHLKVSNDALDIIQNSPGNPERTRTLCKLAFRPSLFERLHSVYGDKSPDTNELRSRLVRLNVNPHVIEDIIVAYHDTIEFIAEELDISASKSLQEIQQEELMQNHNTRSDNQNLRSEVSSQEEGKQKSYNFQLTEDCEVCVTYTGRITYAAIQSLIEYLKLSQKAYPVSKFEDDKQE